MIAHPTQTLKPENVYNVADEKIEKLPRQRKSLEVKGGTTTPANSPMLSYTRDGGKPPPKLIAVYNFKGGVGKTSLAVNISATLAEKGKRVLAIDCDPQCNFTSFFMPPQSLADDGDDGPTTQQAPAPGEDDFLDNIEKIVDRVKPTAEAHAPPTNMLDQSIFALSGVDDVKQAISPPFSQEAYAIQPPQKYFKAEPELYADRLLIIPGSVTLFDNDRELWSSVGGDSQLATHMAFRNIALSSAWAVDADYVIVDLGPSSSLLNQLIIMSCDYILPPVFADYFSLSSVNALLTSLLVGVEAKHKALLAHKAQKEADVHNNNIKKQKAHGYAPPSSMPKLLPFIVTNYRKKDNVFFGPGSVDAKQRGLKGKAAEPADAANNVKYQCQPGRINNGPGKFIAAMRNLVRDISNNPNPSFDISQLFQKTGDHMVVPLVRAIPTMMAASMEVGIPAVSLSPTWLMNHSTEFTSSEQHQLRPDHLYIKGRFSALAVFLESL